MVYSANFHIVFVLIYLFCFSSCAITNFYENSLNNLTSKIKELKIKENYPVERLLLQLLGLSERPKGKFRYPSLRKSAPQYLLNVYDVLSQTEANPRRIARDTNTNQFLIDIDRKIIEESNNIMTFLSKDLSPRDATIRDNKRGKRIIFNTNNIGKDLTVIAANLRLYKNFISDQFIKSDDYITISLYDALETKFIVSLNTTKAYIGWLEINVTKVLERWSKIPFAQNSNGFYIKASLPGHHSYELDLEEMNLISTRESEENQPFMIGYFKGPELLMSKNFDKRVKRYTPKIDYSQNYDDEEDIEEFDMIPDFQIFDVPNVCQRQNFSVDFKDLDWQDWIIAPEKFDAFYCSGRCLFPISDNDPPTNHALIMTLLHLNRPELPATCCVPTELNSISVLYYTNEDNVNLKRYKNMVVESCGCK